MPHGMAHVLIGHDWKLSPLRTRPSDAAAGGAEIRDLLLRVGKGERTKSEALGHREFVLTYKQFDPLEPGCLSRCRPPDRGGYA